MSAQKTRLALATSLATISIFACAPGALAQEAAPEEAEASDIVVAGTPIKSAGLTSTSPDQCTSG